MRPTLLAGGRFIYPIKSERTDMQSLSDSRAHAHPLPVSCHINASLPVPAESSTRAFDVPTRSEGAAVDLGLDSSQTSGFHSLPSFSSSSAPGQNQNQSLLVDARAMKVKRARYATLNGARLHMAEQPKWVGTFIGCTYRPGCNYNPRHVSHLILNVRRWCKRNGIECRYIWVAEMQKRGVIHYHLIVFHPKRLTFPKPDLNGWWPHGSTSRSTGIKRAVAYMAKYLSKGDVAAFPKGARTYGCGGLEGTAKLEMRWWKLPTWVREVVTPDDRAKRVLGGFVNRTTAEVLPSPWRVLFKGGMVYIQRKEMPA